MYRLALPPSSYPFDIPCFHIEEISSRRLACDPVEFFILNHYLLFKEVQIIILDKQTRKFKSKHIDLVKISSN